MHPKELLSALRQKRTLPTAWMQFTKRQGDPLAGLLAEVRRNLGQCAISMGYFQPTRFSHGVSGASS
jgi:hypothetical protein